MSSSALIVIPVILFLCSYTSGNLHCLRGYKVHTPRSGPDVCEPCQNGTFISDDQHTHRKCHNCTMIENPDLENVVTLCNMTHNSVILCQHGYFRREARNIREKDRCEKCQECRNTARECQDYDDSVCCLPNHDAVRISDGSFICQERPVVCGPGQYFRAISEECLPCPTDTYMHAHNHRNRGCLKCEQLSADLATHAVISQHCSKTSPTLFGCERGYFRDLLKLSPLVEATCSPCQKCLVRELRKCDMFYNTVCDDQNYVTDTLGMTDSAGLGSIDSTDQITDGQEKQHLSGEASANHNRKTISNNFKNDRNQSLNVEEDRAGLSMTDVLINSSSQMTDELYILERTRQILFCTLAVGFAMLILLSLFIIRIPSRGYNFEGKKSGTLKHIFIFVSLIFTLVIIAQLICSYIAAVERVRENTVIALIFTVISLCILIVIFAIFIYELRIFRMILKHTHEESEKQLLENLRIQLAIEPNFINIDKNIGH